jgi:hypothetical protein
MAKLLMAGIRKGDKRLTARAGNYEQRTPFVPSSQYVLFGEKPNLPLHCILGATERI